MPIGSTLLRLLGVVAMTAAPAAALDTSSTPNIATGDAVAVPADGGVQNTGGNVEVGTGESTSTVVVGNPSAAPAAPSALAVVPKAVVPAKAPGADAVARARALVDAAKARAEAQIAAARAEAERAAAAARAQAEQAAAHAQAQSDAARANAEAQAASSHS